MLARLAFMAFLWQQTAKMSEFAIQFVMTKLTSVFLGPVGAGIYGVVGSTLGLILIGSLFGFEVSANNFLARNADNPNRISFLARALFSRRFVIVIILGLGMFIGAPALANITNIQNPVYYRFAALILIFSSTSSLLTYFQFALFRNKQAMFARVGSLIVQVALLLWFLRHGWGVRGALIAQTLGMAFMFIWFAALGFKLMIPKPEPIPLKPVYKFGITLWVQDLMNFAISKSAAIWILSIFAVPMNLIGLCNAAFNVRMMVDGFFIQGMGATALAATARIAKQGSGERLPQAWLYNVKT
ncbi:MAG: oligosaccharide flippase family protein, partial [bacterium]